MENNRKTGRPRVVHIYGKKPQWRWVKLTEEEWNMLPEDSIERSNLISILVRERFGDGTAMLRNIDSKITQAKDDLSLYVSRHNTTLQELVEEREKIIRLMKARIKIVDLYPLVAFKTMVSTMRDPKRTPTLQGSREVYGISCNMRKVITEREDILHDLEQNSTDAWIERYDIKKDIHGSREDAIMAEIMKDVVK